MLLYFIVALCTHFLCSCSAYAFGCNKIIIIIMTIQSRKIILPCSTAILASNTALNTVHPSQSWSPQLYNTSHETYISFSPIIPHPFPPHAQTINSPCSAQLSQLSHTTTSPSAHLLTSSFLPHTCYSTYSFTYLIAITLHSSLCYSHIIIIIIIIIMIKK